LIIWLPKGISVSRKIFAKVQNQGLEISGTGKVRPPALEYQGKWSYTWKSGISTKGIGEKQSIYPENNFHNTQNIRRTPELRIGKK